MPAIRSFRHRRLARDDMQPDAAADLLEFLRDKLSPEDHATFAKMLGADPYEAMDEPNPFPGRPRPGGAMDMRRRARPLTDTEKADFDSRFPHAAKIRVNP